MHKGLGKGLQSLIPTIASREIKSKETLINIPISKISPNKYQPRVSFNDEKLKELSDSIKRNGLAQPILVSASDIPGEYELIAGERRLRACRLAKMQNIPAIVRLSTDKEKFQLSLIENLQRTDLNPIEEAEAFNRIMHEFKFTQEHLSSMLGIGRSKIANTLRLLSLPDDIKEAVKLDRIPFGHARALISLNNPLKQKELSRRIIKEKLTAREVEEIVQNWKKAISTGKVKVGGKKPPEIQEIENRLQHILGTKVSIKYRKQKGTISIAFYSLDHFDSLVSALKANFKN
ncbi:MAG: ParB/RepB/Spo0J family partition protein [bacterium]